MLDRARELDGADPLDGFRDRFTLPDGVIYLDGNSLGALPKAAVERVHQVVTGEWGEGLIRSWNDAHWINLPQRIGAKIAPLIGAQPNEVIVADSVSVNLFKLISAALKMRPERKIILSEPGNFPTDLYMIQGLQEQGLAEQRLAARVVAQRPGRRSHRRLHRPLRQPLHRPRRRHRCPIAAGRDARDRAATFSLVVVRLVWPGVRWLDVAPTKQQPSRNTLK